MSPVLKAIGAVSVLAAVMFGLWVNYSDDIKKTPAELPTATLDQMETVGVPKFVLPNIGGVEVNLADFEGKIVIVNFWATWCPPCVKEFPSMLKLIEHFKGEVVLIAISADKNDKDIHTFLNAFGGVRENVYVLRDPMAKVAESYATYKLPESFVVGRDLKLIKKIVGVEDWFSEGSKSYFEGLVNNTISPKDKSK
jgi:cytochrome c biogenesis protein CcmG, thiol:disulfide interchange protein DsbE